ncbi:hypothetical protein HOK51_08965 [Candidatus Woesearchaeota archaeon]|jgi:hypothetical protein|nr:hypothetical protein [Candidatus Woesearchaeota archaeon]MBT6519959.1 hypothetical protein [Candidatus Woesearchaeota archaeon]MBT7367840.1 hypothetical protein [Candidatus Woesearchaeota archaeon]
MKKRLKLNKQAFDYILLDYLPDYNLVDRKEEFKKFNFLDTYRKNEFVSDAVINSIASVYDLDQLKKIEENLILPAEFFKYMSSNLLMYYLLKFETSISDVKKFILEEFNNENTIIRLKRKLLNNLFNDSNKSTEVMLFFPALNWFYSEKTKHLYSKELIEQMEKYKAELSKLTAENCTYDPGPWRKLRVSKWPVGKKE